MAKGNRLYLLPSGEADLHESVLTPDNYQDRRVVVPIWGYLIQTSDSSILIDTGMPEQGLRDPKSLFPDGKILPVMQEEHLITNRLQLVGLRSGDLDFVVNSHLHFDHGGGNELLRDRPFVIHKREYDEVLHGPQEAPWFCKDISYRQIEGDVELAPGFWALSTPGHSPGHMSFLLYTENNGPILLTIDASYTADTFSPETLGAMADPESGAKSVLKLSQLAKDESAKIFFGHDLVQGRQWKHAPQYYD